MNISRRSFLGSTITAALVPLIAQAQAEQQARPNFIVILADDLGYGDLACYGHPIIKTPVLDSLASTGLRLTDCYSSAPVCSPSRCGLLTGRIPHRAGIDDWIPQGSVIHLRREELTLPQLLKSSGYATAHVGKWHCNGKFNNPAQQPQPGDAGFDHWFSTQNNAGPSHANPVNFVRNGQRMGPLKGYSCDLIVDEAIAWLRYISTAPAENTKPFFLFVCFHNTHEPVATAREFIEMYPNAGEPGKANYYGNVTQMDAAIGRLMGALDELKVRQNTMTFFTSDNGPEGLKRYVRATNCHGSAGPYRACKLHLYEGGIRVPGIVNWPGQVKPNMTSAEPVINLDLLPTLAAAADALIPPKRHIDGANILPVLESKPIERKTPLYWQYDVALGGPKFAMRVGANKLLAREGFSGLELYNLEADPSEKDNLADRQPALREQLLAQMQGLHTQIKAEEPIWPKPPATAPAR